MYCTLRERTHIRLCCAAADVTPSLPGFTADVSVVSSHGVADVAEEDAAVLLLSGGRPGLTRAGAPLNRLFTLAREGQNFLCVHA